MTDRQRKDIVQEFVDLYKREEMLAFFDFTLEREGRDPISGLCRISQPKRGKSKMRYLSLTFLADTPDADARAAVQAVLASLEGSGLKASLPEVFEVVLVPVMSAGGENYVGQIDLLLDRDLDTDRRFLSVRLLPAIRQCTGAKAGEMVWWDSAESRPTPPAERTGSLLSRLMQLLGTKTRR
jgi:hypothetical protein